MSRLSRSNAILLLAVAALAAIAYFLPGSKEPVDYPLSGLKAAAVSTVRLERPGVAALALEKKETGWVITAPFAARADPGRLQLLLEVIGAKSAYKMPATGLERFELDRPAARLTIDGQVFSYGMVNAVTREQYVMTGDAVYSVHPRYGAALPAVPVDLASRQLFGPGETPARIETGDFTVVQFAGKWTLSPSPTGEPSQDDFVRWIDQWRFASAIRVEPFVGGKPRADVRIKLKNGADLVLGTLASGANLVLTRPDEKLQYHFRTDVARRLLSPPGAPEPRAEKK